ncbi:LSU ribosomal protein L29P [Isosphaera pallida ATCC 43644]|jgi:large subunit ribosomal protein L29|uniref:Large ribosomal subunit protein uL29 n=1 Tax=Isosphaera pallida (strain ATCC 43644 / DSM 9630 / IS1B) TaxID=575540 RepID=E8R3T2_ISOPI|nr:50S ribosomal protein L29 [Isosphaera pallida]ADV62667.1 LSU ribosomal protein L29P [Isosphaera pallida ATCC 43644]
MNAAQEYRKESTEQLQLTLKEIQRNLFRLRVQSETEKLQAPTEISKAKKSIARILTILRERELEAQRSGSTTS